jgi:protein subunit release factor B
MMVTMYCHECDLAEFDVAVLNTPKGAFLSMRNGTVHIYLPGYDQDCARVARQLASALLAGAEKLETNLTASDQAVQA